MSKSSVLRARWFRHWDFVIPSDFVIRHSDLRTRAFGYRELHLIARRARALRPDRNEVIPLVEMLSDGSFKSTHDFLGQFVARLARAQSRAVIGYLREDVGGVALVRARQIHGQQDTAGSASQLRRRDGGGKFAAEKFHQHGARRRWTVHEQRNGRACL